ncbi:MAG: dehydrogenase [Aquificota bacterium]|nr:MAG: dehydrogenase [Aquificota bacterium]
MGLCAGCGCSCGYIAYFKGSKLVDIYGDPSDPRGMGSLCTKGITYLHELTQNPLRLKGIFAKKEEEFERISYEEALEVLKNKLSKGKTAFLLGRQAGLEDYFVASEVAEVFVDAPVVDFLPSTIPFTSWSNAKFILSVDAEPVFSEVMSTRFLVDAVEKGAYLFCLSSRYETVCAKANKRLLLKPDQMLDFLKGVISPEKGDELVEFVKRSLFLLKGSLVLVGSHLLSSPFGEELKYILSELRKRFYVNYSIVGDVMPFPAKELREFFERIEEFDNVVVVGNVLRYLGQRELELLKDRFVVSFELFPNFTAHHSNLVFGMKNFNEREFINYRHGFGFLAYSPQVMVPEEGLYSLSEVFARIFPVKADLGKIRKGLSVLDMKNIEELENKPKGYPKGELYIHTAPSLVEEVGHWYPWTHEIEQNQRAYINPHTARKYHLKERVEVGGISFELVETVNVAEGVIYIPSEYEEFQPFNPGVSVGRFLKTPYYRYEVFP